jgi:hypothetical protein
MVPLVDVDNVMEIEQIWSTEKTTHLDTFLTYILRKKKKIQQKMNELGTFFLKV